MTPNPALSDAPPETAAAETEEAAQDPQALAKQWLASLESAAKIYEKWHKRAERITKRYRADAEQTPTSEAATKFNIFWSNVQTLAPATYSRRPKVDVSRRFRDQDPVARLAGMILERALQYEVDCGLDFHHTMEACVLDRLLGGQAVAWTRYEPTFKQEEQQVPSEADPMALETQIIEVIDTEKTPTDYVFWKDFLISPARTWQDARWVARRVMFSKDALTKRFQESCAALGGDISQVPCDYDPSQTDPDKRGTEGGTNPAIAEGDTTLRRALVWEIWDKETKQLIWVCKGYDFPLDVKDDPVQLQDFWPIPRPLWATMTNDTLVPVPDFVIYVSQLRELDEITNRISMLTKALRVIGVYDASQAALQTLLQGGMENRMVPVNSWAAFAEKGGLKGTMDFVPIEQILLVLKGLYEAREVLKQTIFEITGMADIVRGATVASETLGAQQIKAKFANLRLSSRQQQTAEFCTGILQIKAQIMCRQYSPETLVKISAAEQITECQGPEGQQKLQAAIALLKDENVRQYRIEVAASSMIELDEVDERERRNEFMSSVSNFMLAVKNIAEVAPPMMPVALEMLKFVVRGFNVGRSLEASIEDASDAIMAQLKAPKPPPPPSPEEVKLKISAADIASKEKIALGEIMLKMKIAQSADATKIEVAELKASTDVFLEKMGLAVQSIQQDQQRADEQRQSDREFDQTERASEREALAASIPEPADLSPVLDQLAQFSEMLSAMQDRLSKKRVRTPTYDADGNVTRVEETIEP